MVAERGAAWIFSTDRYPRFLLPIREEDTIVSVFGWEIRKGENRLDYPYVSFSFFLSFSLAEMNFASCDLGVNTSRVGTQNTLQIIYNIEIHICR